MNGDQEVSAAPCNGGNRIEWVDVAKALGLFLVFWGHLLYGGSATAGVINRAIYSFHMPMYFILSGYVLKRDTMSLVDYIIAKFNRILLPAIILYFLTLPIYFYNLDYSVVTLKSVISDIFYVKGHCAYNSPIWFFICLFQVLIIVKVFKLTSLNRLNLIFVLVITLLISFWGYLLRWRWFGIFGLNKCLLGLFFFVCGMLLKRVRYEEFSKTIGLVALPIWFITGVWLNSKVSMYSMQLGSLGLFVVSGLVGSFSFFALSKLLENDEKIRQYAKWTIFIVCSHYVLRSLFFLVANRMSFKGTYFYDILSLVFVLIALVLYKPVCAFLEKHIPVLLGLKNATKNN